MNSVELYWEGPGDQVCSVLSSVGPAKALRLHRKEAGQAQMVKQSWSKLGLVDHYPRVATLCQG
jgi:hypothetical protein